MRSHPVTSAAHAALRRALRLGALVLSGCTTQPSPSAGGADQPPDAADATPKQGPTSLTSFEPARLDGACTMALTLREGAARADARVVAVAVATATTLSGCIIASGCATRLNHSPLSPPITTSL